MAQLNTGVADVLKTKDSPYPQSGRSRDKLGTSLHRGESRPRHKFRAAAAPPEETWACAADERTQHHATKQCICMYNTASQSVSPDAGEGHAFDETAVETRMST